ncbi:head-tail adaptor protein [Galbibacter sp. BG1]|uniref:head-tail adaptor protein n=1 Tax=Galbibacter sp. BG1 TaxID=1170699 RepID=UPI0015BBAC4E|nr:head-tail adaptor protein [Galbibacter sp. BG1]QLE02886.1 head-tail adaptor protein [Galbibacter sp. BG1]
MAEQMYIGKMDRRIAIVKRIKSKSTSGADSYTETTLATVWAEKKELKSEEAVDDKVVTINAHQFVIRFHPEIASEKVQHLYLVDENDEYDIYGVEMVGRKQFIKINCERRE